MEAATVFTCSSTPAFSTRSNVSHGFGLNGDTAITRPSEQVSVTGCAAASPAISKKQIAAVENQGFYKIISVVTDDWIQVGGQPFLYFNYTFENGLDTKSSYLMVTGYDGNFLKVRLTTDANLDTQVFDAFMDDFGRLISGLGAS